MWMPMTDSCWGLTENNKSLQSTYPSIKNFFFIIKKEYHCLGPWKQPAPPIPSGMLPTLPTPLLLGSLCPLGVSAHILALGDLSGPTVC